MIIKSIIIFYTLFLITVQAYSGETCTVDGTIRTPYDGDIYIGLYTKTCWQNHRDGFPSYPYFQIIRVTGDLVKAKKIPFKFEGIKKGNYCIIAYQDKNKNGNIDRLLGGHIIEPRGLYKESIMEPCWKNMSFKLEQNLKNVEIAISDSGY